MDDFCKAFYGGPDGEPVVKTYTFEDVVSTLNTISPHNWTSFFRMRLDSTGPNAPVGGIMGGGWRLVYNDDPNEILSADEEVSGSVDLTSSIGLRVKRDGSIIDSIPGMPAFESGLNPYLKIVGVNGRRFSVDELRRTIRDSRANSVFIEVEVDNSGTLQSHRIQYHGGSQFPHLERVNGTPDYLDEILKPLTLERAN
jgi:predicted metalloprotease with PDZ domain